MFALISVVWDGFFSNRKTIWSCFYQHENRAMKTFPVLFFRFCVFCNIHAHCQSFESVYEKYIEKLGGKAALDSVKSITMAGLDVVSGKHFDIKNFKTKQPHRHKLTLTNLASKETTCFVFSGKGIVIFSEGKTINMPNENESNSSYFINRLIEYKEKNLRPVLVGMKVADGKECFEIKLMVKSGLNQLFYIDTATHLLVMDCDESDKGNTSNHYTDYRKVGNVLFPYTYTKETYMGGSKVSTSTTTCTSMAVNTVTDFDLMCISGD